LLRIGGRTAFNVASTEDEYRDIETETKRVIDPGPVTETERPHVSLEDCAGYRD